MRDTIPQDNRADGDGDLGELGNSTGLRAAGGSQPGLKAAEDLAQGPGRARAGCPGTTVRSSTS